ncbi:MAG: hypothetical protein ACJ73S_06805 [Mycobacteriales bacterium]
MRALLLTAIASGAFAWGTTAAAGSAQAEPAASSHQLTVHANSVQALQFRLSQPGESILDLTAAAPGVDWGVTGHESTVVSTFVDGKYVTDVVIPSSRPIAREFFLGHLAAGAHSLSFTLATDRSRGGNAAILSGIGMHTVTEGSPDYAVYAHAPVLYGRTLAQYGGPFQNAFTDVPLIAWHEATPQPDGSTQLRYTIVWSNEDGGTGLAPASLMARWGRTTDIEWIYHAGVYQLTLDPDGNVVPGSEFYQAPQHGNVPFAGNYENHHPVLQTCTDNNNVCDQLDADAQAHPMRFTLSVAQELPAGQAREVMMDRNGWTYWVTAREMQREGKVEATADPNTPDLSDERNYLYLVLKKTTTGPSDNTKSPWVGAGVAVKLKGSDTLYRSDHAQPGWTLQRDDPAATTVELPVGTTASDIEQIIAFRSPNALPDNGDTIQVERIDRAMFLDQNYLPQPYFIQNYAISGVTLTQASPSQTVWTNPV